MTDAANSPPPAAGGTEGTDARRAGTARIDPHMRQSDEIFRRLIDSVHDYAIFMLTPEGYIASWNAGAARIKGYRADEAIGLHFSSFYTPEAVASGWPAEELRRAAAEGRLEDEGWRVRKDGSRFWANVIISPLRADDGTLLGYSKVTRDLTERRQHERRLQDSEGSLRMLVEGVKDHAMYLVDADGCIATWNAGAQRLFGHGAQAALGADLEMLYEPKDRAAGKARAELASARAAGSLQAEGWRRRADGSRFWADVTTTVLHDDAGPVRGYVQIVRDLSERRRVEALESEGRRIAEFISMLSHELRNPLAPIRNAATVLGKLVESSEARWCTELIERQVTHLARLVDDLLEVGRVTSGKLRIEQARQELGTVLRQAADSAQSTMQAFGHTLAVQLDEGPLPVIGDATRLHQMAVNLLNNAAKYTPNGGHVAVSLSREGPNARLQVADDGVGMSEALLARAFEPFVQGERTLDRAQGGLGIGLTLAKTIVEAHGGTISIASAGAQRGTTVTVMLPIAGAAAAGEHAPARARLPSHGTQPLAAPRPQRLLVVDDHVDAAQSLARLLRTRGYEVAIAHDGAQALALAAQRAPQAVLLDIGLPGMDGYEVARRLRQIDAPGGMRLIAITGYGQQRDREASLRAGFEAHLVKPIDPDDLAALLDAGT